MLPSKGSCARDGESQTLTTGVCHKGQDYLQSIMLKRPKLPSGIQATVCQDSVKGEGHRMKDQFMDILPVGWLGVRYQGDAANLNHQPPGSNQPGI